MTTSKVLNPETDVNMSKPKHYSRTLTIAGSDSGGGAGIQADLKTFSALGCYGFSVITALTAQNTQNVTGIQQADADFVARQIDTVMEDIGADAVKIGMLFSADIIRTVADRLKAHQVKNIVLDPVMVAKSGDKLLQDDAIDEMVTHLFPLATLITPNLPETRVLSGLELKTDSELPDAAEILINKGAENVLIKGGHFNSDTANDSLYCTKGGDNKSMDVYTYSGRKIDTPNTHGTGCTYSSAIAAHLAQGDELQNAVKFAKQYISGAIEAGARYQLGGGHGPVHHFFDIWHE